jgi:hypothetical protein
MRERGACQEDAEHRDDDAARADAEEADPDQGDAPCRRDAAQVERVVRVLANGGNELRNSVNRDDHAGDADEPPAKRQIHDSGGPELGLAARRTAQPASQPECLEPESAVNRSANDIADANHEPVEVAAAAIRILPGVEETPDRIAAEADT